MARDPIDYGQFDEGRDCNYWQLDPTLRFEARRAYPDEEYAWAQEVLDEYGAACGHTIAENADVVDRNGPELHTYDRDGQVQNRVEYHPLQFENERVTYGEYRLTHDAFHPPPGRDEPVGLVHPLAMQTLLCFADAGFTCPASMTTGAAVVLDAFDDGSLDEYLDGLTTADYGEHIEGAMFLTEKQGGSDVGANEVRAEPQADGTYELYGEKWFCSNIDAQGALVLARTPDAPDGTAGLSLFLVPRELPDGTLNDAVFRRLKDKLGTISVPTGEIQYEGATGYLVGEEERGFRYMAEMMNFERLSNATAAVGIMGRALLEAKVHAANREAFGEVIQEYPLMRRDLVDMQVDYEAATAFAFETVKWYDRRMRGVRADEEGGDGNGDAADEGGKVDAADEGGKVDAADDRAYRLMRLLTPIAKYRTAEMSVETASYAMEVLGGNGYVEEYVTARLFRDAQVLPIWEGTSNVLSLDVLRALDRVDAHEALLPFVRERIEGVDHPYLDGLAGTVEERFHELQNALATLAAEDEDYAQYHAKRLADLIFDVVTAAVLLEGAQWAVDEQDDARKALVAGRFVDTRFGDDEAYGVTSGDRFAIEHFDAVVRHAGVDPDALVETAAADD